MELAWPSWDALCSPLVAGASLFAAAVLTPVAAEAQQSVMPAARMPGSPQAARGGLQQESKQQPLPQQALPVALLAQSYFFLLGISSPL